MSEQTYKMIPPRTAFEMLEGNPSAVLIDVRSDMEYLMVGHPKGAVHISWIDAPDWTVNPNFVAEVRKALDSVHRAAGLGDRPAQRAERDVVDEEVVGEPSADSETETPRVWTQ